MAQGPAGSTFDSRPIQEVVVVDQFGNFTTSGGGGSVISGTVNIASGNVQGVVGQGIDGSAVNPILIGGLDSNNPALLQPAQVDTFNDINVNLGTKLDPYNDAVNAILSFGYPTQQRAAASANGATTIVVQLAPANANASGAATPLANSLGLAGMPNAAPVQWARFTLENSGTGQTVNSLALRFYDTIDATNDTITYTYAPTVSQGTGSILRWWFPINTHYGVYPNAQLSVGLAAAASIGYIQVQTMWGLTPITSFPREWSWDFSTQIQSSQSTSLVAAPPAGTRICIEELMVTNASASAATDFSFQAGSNGTAIWQQEAYYQGGGFKYGPFAFEQPYRMALATALFGKCTASSSVFVTGRGHYEPI